VTEVIRADLEKALGESVGEITPIPEGHSGFTYYVDVPGARAVLRLPPPGARIAGPADIPRQGRIMKALREQGVPTPPILAMSEEPIVDGRPFVLMERVEGSRIEAIVPGADGEAIAGSAIEVLKRMQAVPRESTGIGHEEPMPLSGEMTRWAWLMERAPAELTERAPVLGGLLADRVPDERQPCLVHGDYHYGNMLFHNSAVVAVLDWEIAELGQPLLDLACQCVVAVTSRVASEAVAIPGGGSVDVPVEWLLERYGAAASEFDWYLALTFYKYASIFGYNLMLHRRGKRPDPTYEERAPAIPAFIEEGIKLLVS
jgi:aminoglycoside phosphotransferase (APT) family kinase protein